MVKSVLSLLVVACARHRRTSEDQQATCALQRLRTITHGPNCRTACTIRRCFRHFKLTNSDWQLAFGPQRSYKPGTKPCRPVANCQLLNTDLVRLTSLPQSATILRFKSTRSRGRPRAHTGPLESCMHHEIALSSCPHTPARRRWLSSCAGFIYWQDHLGRLAVFFQPGQRAFHETGRCPPSQRFSSTLTMPALQLFRWSAMLTVSWLLVLVPGLCRRRCPAHGRKPEARLGCFS